jgi:1-acyl-sn-glycerol-3-phosphate acyltransferase
MLKIVASFLLKLLGWRVTFSLPACDKYVLVGAPHTSNWDFPFGLLAMSACGLRFNWVGKHTLFKRPFGWFMSAIGGIPVDRRGGTGFVKKAIDIFAGRDHFVLAIAPEGTRSLTRHWKCGFYHIAVAAGVPIALGFIDYPRKRIGIDHLFVPSGDIEADFEILRKYYQDKIGKRPENQGPVRFKDIATGEG